MAWSAMTACAFSIFSLVCLRTRGEAPQRRELRSGFVGDSLRGGGDVAEMSRGGTVGSCRLISMDLLFACMAPHRDGSSQETKD